MGHTSPLLVNAPELQTALGAQPPLLLDGRPADAFAHGLIPGALHLDLWGVSLIDTSDAPLRAFMWMIGHLFASRGVAPDRPVVVYEQDSGLRAARLLWFLEYLGHPNVRLLDGGVRAWTDAGYALTTDARPPVPGGWHGTPSPDLIATWSGVLDALERSDAAIVDTRSDDEYFGRIARARRAGAIPGAVHVEWTRNLDERGRFKSARDLEAMYRDAGVTPDREVVTYCQGGYRAAHSYVALRLAGFPRVRNYTGSWKEWGDREDLPIEVPPIR